MATWEVSDYLEHFKIASRKISLIKKDISTGILTKNGQIFKISMEMCYLPGFQLLAT